MDRYAGIDAQVRRRMQTPKHGKTDAMRACAGNANTLKNNVKRAHEPQPPPLSDIRECACARKTQNPNS